MKKQSFLFFGFAFFLIVLFLSLFIFTRNQIQSFSFSAIPLPSSPMPSPSLSPVLTSFQTKETVRVIRVIDGDTIEIEGGKKVRYIGMNAPELADKRDFVRCFAQKAKEKNRELVEGKLVYLKRDISEVDKYGRLLRYVYQDNLFINEILVTEGYARVASYPPDIAFQERLREAEREAREKKLGLWGNTCM